MESVFRFSGVGRGGGLLFCRDSFFTASGLLKIIGVIVGIRSAINAGGGRVVRGCWEGSNRDDDGGMIHDGVAI